MTENKNWLRAFWTGAENAPTWIYILLICLGIAALLPLAPDFGKSIDIKFCEMRGHAAYEYYFNGFDGERFREALSPMGRYYGPAFDVLITVAQGATEDPVRKFEIRTALQALFNLSGLIPLFLIAARLISRPAALITVILVASTPAFFGHAFINPKDSIFASMFLWSLWLLLECFGDGRKPSYRHLVAFGIALGLTASLRYIGVYLLLLVPLAAILLPSLVPVAGAPTISGFASRFWKQCLIHVPGFLIVAFVATVAFFLSMPAFLADFRSGALLEMFRLFKGHPLTMDLFYFGEVISSQELPRHYLYGQMLVQLPLYYHLFLLTTFVVLLAKARVAAQDVVALERDAYLKFSTLIILAVAVAIPLILFVIMKPVVYNGFRHILFVIPLVLLLLLFGFVWSLAHIPNAARLVLCLLAGLLWIQAVLAMVRLHPYEYVYYNPLANPSGRFELDYWGTAYREVAQKLNAYADAREGKTRVFACGEEIAQTLDPFLDRSKIELVSLKAEPELMVTINQGAIRYCLPRLKKAKGGATWFFTVEREGAILAAVARVAPSATSGPPSSRPSQKESR